MRYCKDCDHSKKEGFQTPQGWQTIMICESGECREPVSGDMIPCEIARREQVFCGIQGKHFTPKVEKTPASVLEIAK
jgi:hypothetical protein